MSIWFMFDNHTFKQLSDNKKYAIREALKLFDKDQYGSVGVKGTHGNGLQVIGRGDRKAFEEDLTKWIASKDTYFEEKKIDSIIYWRVKPNDTWTPYTIKELSAKYAELKKI